MGAVHMEHIYYKDNVSVKCVCDRLEDRAMHFQKRYGAERTETDPIRAICSDDVDIVIIATFVTMVKMFTNAFLPELYSTLGVFISLIVVNCIVLGRAEAYASKNTVFDSLIDALGMGVGYTLAIISMALFREILGTGAFSFGKIFTFIPAFKLQIIPKGYEISVFQNPAGAFIVFAIILAVIAFIKNRKAEYNKYLAEQERLKKLAEAKAKEGAK